MKKITFKTLLVAVGLLVSASSWGQTVTTYDFEDENALFTADSRVTVSVVSGTQTIYNEDFAVDGKAVSFKGAGNAQNGYCFSHLDFSSLCDKAAKVKVEFEAVLGNGARSIISVGDASVRGNTGNSSKTTYSNKGAIFRVGTDKTNSYINAANVGASTAVSQKWLKVTVEVDEVQKKYSYSIVNKATDEEIKAESDIAFYSSDATNCTQIDMFGYINNSQMGLIDNIVITVTKDERKQADYTVNFLDTNGNPIKDAVVRSGAVGDPIVLLPADKEPLWNADGTQKYFYKSDDTEGVTIADGGTTVVNITYRDAEVYNYTLMSSLGATLASGSGFEGESPRIAYPRYQLEGTTLYEAGVDNKEYRKTINLTADNASATVTYTEKAGVEVAFYTEAETIEGVTIATNNNIPVRASNALAATATGDVTITTLPAGKYKFHVGIFTSKTSNYSDKTMNFGIGDETFAAGYTGVNLNEIASDEYELKGTTDITYLGTTSWDGGEFDYIWIEKTGDATLPANASVTVGSDGWATYVAEYDLDFSGVAGLEAYTATTDGSTVELTKVDDVAIGTCLVLKGAGTHTVPLIATSTTAKGGLTSGAVADVTADTKHVYYGLAMIGGKAKFAKIATGAIADGKAYFMLDATSPAREILDIDGETTGIENVKAAAENSVIYNLQGVRVAQPTKGLYIMDGKKMVIK